MSGTQNRPLGNLHLYLQINDVIITSADVIDFSFTNIINAAPSGYFKIIDGNGDLFSQSRTATYGRFYFSDTSDNKDEKASYVDFLITNINQEGKYGNDIMYMIKWQAGNRNAVAQKTVSYTGTSIDVLNKITDDYSYITANYLTENNVSTSDTMTWRLIQDNMWDQLSGVVNKSWLANDYIFWAYDDVNNVIKISSLNTEKSYEPRHIFLLSSNANTNTDEATLVKTNPDYTVWYYDKDLRQNTLGSNLDKLFPNVSFTGVVDTDVKQAGYKKSCFVDMVKSMGDIKQDKILNNSDVDNSEVFGPLMVRRHYPNNVHKFYAGADIFRDRELATYGKTIYINIYNKVGPALGSKSTIIALSGDYKIRGANLDEVYSDTYILTEKNIKYTSTVDTIHGPVASGDAKFRTTLKFVSDHIGSENFSEVENIIKQLNVKVS